MMPAPSLSQLEQGPTIDLNWSGTKPKPKRNFQFIKDIFLAKQKARAHGCRLIVEAAMKHGRGTCNNAELAILDEAENAEEVFILSDSNKYRVFDQACATAERIATEAHYEYVPRE